MELSKQTFKGEWNVFMGETESALHELRLEMMIRYHHNNIDEVSIKDPLLLAN